MFPWSNDAIFTTTSLNWENGIAMLLFLSWMISFCASGSHASSFPSLGHHSSRENTDNWKTFYLHFFREATFISSELHQNEKSFPGIALWTTDRSVETTANPAPADCSITCKKGSVSHFAVTSPFQNSAKLLSFRYLFLKPPGNAELWQKLQKVLVLCKLNPPDVPIPQYYFRLFGTEDMDR